jgi:hypothetical protein
VTPLAPAPPAPAASPESYGGPTYAEVARRAYEIYEREGRPAGREIEHWLRAEQELRGLPAD